MSRWTRRNKRSKEQEQAQEKSKQSQKVELKPFPTPTITFCCLIKCEQLISLQLEKAFEEAFTWAGGRWVGVKVTTLPASCI